MRTPVLGEVRTRPFLDISDSRATLPPSSSRWRRKSATHGVSSLGGIDLAGGHAWSGLYGPEFPPAARPGEIVQGLPRSQGCLRSLEHAQSRKGHRRRPAPDDAEPGSECPTCRPRSSALIAVVEEAAGEPTPLTILRWPDLSPPRDRLGVQRLRLVPDARAVGANVPHVPSSRGRGRHASRQGQPPAPDARRLGRSQALGDGRVSPERRPLHPLQPLCAGVPLGRRRFEPDARGESGVQVENHGLSPRPVGSWSRVDLWSRAVASRLAHL